MAIAGNAQQEAFGCGCHGSRINGVVAHIRAVIYAGHDHVRQRVKHAGDRKMHTIRGRAVDVKKPIMGFVQAEGAIERKRITGAAAVPFRRDHDDVRDR